MPSYPSLHSKWHDTYYNISKQNIQLNILLLGPPDSGKYSSMYIKVSVHYSVGHESLWAADNIPAGAAVTVQEGSYPSQAQRWHGTSQEVPEICKG